MSFDGDDDSPIGNILTQAANATVQYVTGGLVGLNKNGLDKGYSGHAIDETIGEVTGRNMARKANMDAKDALNEEKANKKIEIQNEQTKKGQDDILASNYAASVRAAAAAKKSNSMGGSGSMTPTQDLLGL